MKIIERVKRISRSFGDFYDLRSAACIAAPAYAKYLLRIPHGVRPSHINIEITNRCNLKCKMCNHAVGFNRPMGDMDEATHRTAIDKSVDIPSIAYTGVGEPMLHPKFFEYMEYAVASGRNRRIGLSTNGTFITETNVERLASLGLGYIQLSMDGLDEVYESIRGYPFVKFERNLMRLVKAKEKVQSRTRIYLSVTVANDDVASQVKEIHRRLGSIVDRIDIRPVMTVSARNDMTRKTKSCLQLYVAPIVFWNGNINACCSDHDNNLTIGHVLNEDLIEVYNNKKMCRLRKEIFEGKLRPPCDTCSEICFGEMKSFWG